MRFLPVLRINLQPLHPGQQLQFTLNGPAFRLFHIKCSLTNKWRLIFSFYVPFIFYQIIFLSFISWLLKILVGLLSNSTTWILSPYCRCKSTGSSIHVGSSGGLYICNFVFPPTLNVSLLCQSLLLLLICIYMLIMQGHAILICESMFLNCSPWYHRTGRRHHLMWCIHLEQYMPIPLQHLYAL